MATSLLGPGQQLKAAREERGLTLSDVAHLTRIPRVSLEAIEDERFGDLPAPVFARGFVRSYARAVGLDGQALVRSAKLHAALQPDADGGRGGLRYARSRGIDRTRAGQLLLVCVALAMLIAAWALVGAREPAPPGRAAGPERTAPSLRAPSATPDAVTRPR